MSVIGRTLVSGATTLAIAFSLLTIAAPLRAQYDRPYDQGPQGAYCASNDNRFARCQVPWRDAELVQQASKVRCVRDQTWGFDRNGIWVDHGCRGQFAPARGGNWPPYGHPGWGRQPMQVRCESRGGSYQMCPVDLRRDDSVRMVNQLSGADCREGRSWGWSRDGIWVDRGCRADFEVVRR
ncbi:DUF3011 domain-containing protein [Dyella acidisoli]|uniref:DUF3011 domain-containing protein n=1 Tax=Dyella acidisoli TaxID=1867834 RepID=A0ABQ5XTH5_9GAMM|nr:DUF3011 domain-containing protein [Dyella acidisoli]GLQ95039.1 hypothetical protein GCM10007901_39920 [Dyella acidisoli]